MNNNGNTLFTVDDRDPRLAYQGSWFTTTDPNDYNSTATGTKTAGSVVKFAFNGTLVSVYGTVDSESSSSTYTLDDSVPVVFTSPQSSSPIYNEPFYTSPPLSPGEHTLTINITSDGDYWLDYLRFTAFANETQTDTPGFNSSVPVELAPDSDQLTQAPGGLSTAAIAGIVMGCVAVILVIIGGLLYARGWCGCIKRRKTRSPEKGVDIMIEDMASPPPVMDVFKLRKLIAQRKATPASNTHSSSSRPTQSSAMFTSVIFLTPPVSDASGGSRESNRRVRNPTTPSAPRS